jgi:hypothetical protein
MLLVVCARATLAEVPAETPASATEDRQAA